MKQFLKKVGLFLLIYWGIGQIISLCLPYHWGNPWYHVKIRYLENLDSQAYNCYFFGSSRVYRHFDPQLFDDLNHGDTHSFNLGSEGSFAPELFYLYEHFLESDLSEGVKYCFMEITGVPKISPLVRHNEKNTYCLDFKNLIFVIKSQLYNKSNSRAARLNRSWRYLEAFLENNFHLGHFSGYISHKQKYDDFYLGPAQNGFLSMELEMKNTENIQMRKILKFRKKKNTANPKAFENRIEELRMALEAPTHSHYDEINLQRLNKLIDKSKEKGIVLIPVAIAPFLKQPTGQLNLFKQIPESQKIDLVNPDLFPELFTYENHFDITHLNTRGAKIWTEQFAKEFENYLKAQDHQNN